MGARGELFTTEVFLDNRSYFFNVKENRVGDIFLQIVESKNKEGADFDRHQIAVFAEDMQRFLAGLDKSLTFIEKERRGRVKAEREKRAAQASKQPSARYARLVKGAQGDERDDERDVGRDEERERRAAGVKRTGKVIHIVSKRPGAESASEGGDKS